MTVGGRAGAPQGAPAGRAVVLAGAEAQSCDISFISRRSLNGRYTYAWYRVPADGLQRGVKLF